jgi:hypothetical protein
MAACCNCKIAAEGLEVVDAGETDESEKEFEDSVGIEDIDICGCVCDWEEEEDEASVSRVAVDDRV